MIDFDISHILYKPSQKTKKNKTGGIDIITSTTGSSDICYNFCKLSLSLSSWGRIIFCRADYAKLINFA